MSIDRSNTSEAPPWFPSLQQMGRIVERGTKVWILVPAERAGGLPDRETDWPSRVDVWVIGGGVEGHRPAQPWRWRLA